ncbi:hypothetical protein K402DRAFT_272425 [Aulographum hederae CBS 113979]|uniref:protein kinase C n=1 Tax=Aulographum hederae CBS 113979 TaxID=1176131 RepID=A0A6G1H8Z1_9PEZI|nr:hypothetical protein K402DRAFT_272425 [Aulographum hederae CBS 113979]
MNNEDEVTQNVQRKIERERALITAANNMRQSTNNPAVLSRLDTQIRDGRRNIEYLEGRMRELQMRRMGSDMDNMSLGQNNNGGPAPPAHGQPSGYGGSQDGRGYTRPGDYGTAGSSGYSDLSGGTMPMPPNAPFARPGPSSSPKPRANYSKLDLIKWDTPHLGPRIQLMLSELEFKLSVEKQYKDGIEKMVRLYQLEGDRKSKADAEARRIESNQKIQLLKQALRRYEDLHVDVDGDDGQDGMHCPEWPRICANICLDDSLNIPNARKPLSGHLSIRIHAVADVDHAATGRFSRGPETFVIMKVEDIFKGRTRATRTDKFTDEQHEFDIDKANEIEMTVYDRAGDHPMPIGMLWLRISDIAEEMRRKKIETEFNNQGWVSADKMGEGAIRPELQFNPPPGQSFSAAGSMGPGPAHSGAGAAGATPQTGPIFIDAWFSLEPVGRIHLTMTFIKQTRDRKPFDAAGLGRKGAIRQRKEEVHEQYGHKFVQQQFYTIMRCALCGDFLRYAAGMQCSDCKLTCHKQCYTKVVTKCITQSNAETDPDEAKLNARIPHRFDTFSNMGANWCCHCGYMLPIGRKQSRRCTECRLTCHQACMHFVPDFCGMSMEVANQILGEIKNSKKRQTSSISSMSSRTLRPAPTGRPGPPQQTQTFSAPQGQDQGQEQNRLSYGQPPYQRSSTDYTPGRPGSGGYAPTLDPHAERPSGYGAQPPQPSAPQQPEYNPAAYANYPTQPQQYPPQLQAQAPQQPQQQAPVQRPPQQDGVPPQQTQQVVVPPAEQKKSAPAANTAGTGRRIGLDHFNFLAVLGKGNFGKVMLAETKATKQLYAIKVLKKEFIIENDEVESTRSEKRVFLIANKERHPFLLSLHACFQTETRVYFVMEYISGGDLMLHIQRGQFGTKRAQFYAAEVCLALKYFHENGVIYRDLKLDNILLTLDGHIKIADYGLCKEDMWFGSTTSTFCGTPEFMAPEVSIFRNS